MYTHPILRKANIRRLVSELNCHPLVRSLDRYSDSIRVRYVTGVSETWYFEEIPHKLLLPYDPFDGDDLHVNCQYPYSQNTPLEKMHTIRYRSWYRASFLNKRLVIQELLDQLLSEGYLQIEFPHSELKSDLQVLWDTDLYRRHAWHGTFLLYGHYSLSGSPGRKIIEQFTTWGDYGRRSVRESWTPPILFRAIRDLLKYRRDVTRHSVMWLMSNRREMERALTKYVCPNVYRILFEKFGIKNMVIADPHPTFGSKAIAATMSNNFYCADTDFTGLSSFLGTSFGKLDRDHYDVVILDYDWDDPGDKLVQDLKKWASMADMKLVYVPKRMMKMLPTPAVQARIETHFLKTKNPDFVYCYV